jgi:putative transposase
MDQSRVAEVRRPILHRAIHPEGRDCRDRNGAEWIVDEPDRQKSDRCVWRILRGKRYLIHNRDPLFTDEFLTMLSGVGVKSVKLPARSPNLNAYAERFVRSIKEGCLERMIFFGEGSLRKGIQEFGLHYHNERNHQGLGNRLILPDENSAKRCGTVQRRQRLGGMLNYYHRAA